MYAILSTLNPKITNRKGLVKKVKLSSVMTNAAAKIGGKHGEHKSGTLNSFFVFAVC